MRVNLTDQNAPDFEGQTGCLCGGTMYWDDEQKAFICEKDECGNKWEGFNEEP